jgi:hypothetical protein
MMISRPNYADRIKIRESLRNLHDIVRCEGSRLSHASRPSKFYLRHMMSPGLVCGKLEGNSMPIAAVSYQGKTGECERYTGGCEI